MTKAQTGRPPGRVSLRAAAARSASAAIQALADVANDHGAPAADRVAAASKLLEHASGPSRATPQ